MWNLRSIALACVLLAGCVKPQPASLETVAAYEVVLASDLERAELLALLRQEAVAEGLHLDSASDEWLATRGESIPSAARTIDATIWRGTNDDQPEAGLNDWPEAPGHVWITFARGEDPALASRFRDRVTARLMQRWPDIERLPILPKGTLPNREDLILTPDGYLVRPAAASRYDLPETSPLVAQR